MAIAQLFVLAAVRARLDSRFELSVAQWPSYLLVVPARRLFVAIEIEIVLVVAEVARDPVATLFASNDAHGADEQAQQVRQFVEERGRDVADRERAAAHDQDDAVGDEREGTWDLAHDLLLAAPPRLVRLLVTLVPVREGEAEREVDESKDKERLRRQRTDRVISQLEVVRCVFLR